MRSSEASIPSLVTCHYMTYTGSLANNVSNKMEAFITVYNIIIPQAQILP